MIVKETGGNFEPMPDGLQAAVCSHVVDIGLQHSELYGDHEQLVVCWELAAKMTDGRPFMISKFYTKSLNKKATLRKDLEMWRGQVFTTEELAGFEMDKLIGVNAYLNIIKESAGDKDKFKIVSLSKLPVGAERIKPLGQPVPEWITEKQKVGVEALMKRDFNQESGQKNPNPLPEHSGTDLPF